MSVLDLLARAETSSDLKHHEHDCDVDTLGAAGMAAASNAHMSLFRFKYLNDTTEQDPAKRQMVLIARRVMLNRGLDPSGMNAKPGKPKLPSASRIGVQALHAWLNDVCPGCNGLKFQIIPGTPNLSDKPCLKCNGSGRNPIKVPGEIGEMIKDVLERADAACVTIQRGIDAKLGRD